MPLALVEEMGWGYSVESIASAEGGSGVWLQEAMSLPATLLNSILWIPTLHTALLGN